MKKLLLKENDIIFLPKYFTYNRVSDNNYIIINPVNSKTNFIDKDFLDWLLLIWNKKLLLSDFLKLASVKLNIKNFIIYLNKIYNDWILLTNTNKHLYKFYEDLIVMWNDYKNYLWYTTILLNADKLILRESIGIQSNNILILSKKSKTWNESWDIWLNQCVNEISNNIEKWKNVVFISFDWHPLFWWFFEDALKEKSIKFNFKIKFLPSITYIWKIYSEYFMKRWPMRGFLSIDSDKFLEKKYVDTSSQIIITRLGYSKGIDSVYNWNWKQLVLEEIINLKNKLLEFYDKNTIIFFISSEFRKEEKLFNIENWIEYWIPWHTSIFIDDIT